MTLLDRLIPEPQLRETQRVHVPAPADAVWERVRHGALAQAWPIRVLFGVRSLLMRDAGASPTIRIDELRSSPASPGFQILAEDPPREFAVGAIGKVWRLRIPFVHVARAGDYAAFHEPGFVKVAWAVRVARSRFVGASDVEFEVRVFATDEASRRRFRWYFLFIGPFSRYIRRSLLRAIARGMRPAAGVPSRAGI